ncbi:PotD/PotF family extracellular solute-binding protein [Limosilactobacillus sp.]|uniref:ABC transporter substrate-binding protein n=1 Tax=Limosilactobacillus sp. TaxID=2773925 RepID=UPI00345E4E50
MKRLMTAVVGILLLCLALAGINWRLGQQSHASHDNTLTIYNWGDYIDPALITKFEHQTGIHVDYQTFDSNEAMLTKLRQGGTNYDVVVPSEYTVSRLKREHLLATLNKNRLPNMRYVDPGLLNQSFDRHNRYSVPYFWGTLGIVYNDRLIQRDHVEHWRQLWSTRLRKKLMLIDSARDVFAMALIIDHHSVNTTNLLYLHQAARRLHKLAPNVKAVVADEMKMYMEDGEAAAGVTYSGEAREMMDNDSHLHYLVPSEGSNIWFDNLVIPRRAQHKAAAYRFINFMMEPRNAAQNAKYIGYATPEPAAKKYLPRSVTANRAFYPSAKVMKRLHVYSDLPLKDVGTYNDLFLEFKMLTR